MSSNDATNIKRASNEYSSKRSGGEKRKEREFQDEDNHSASNLANKNRKRLLVNHNDHRHFEGCRSSDLYKDLKKIGEGTYGAVYKARCRETDELFALKKLKLESETEGFPITSIRETMTLLKGKHPHVIDVKEIVFGNRLDEIYIVMEYMDRDLKSLMNDMDRPFNIAETKTLMQQLISAIAHLHKNWILHRDLKTSNLLINKGILKVGDFGLAREYGSPLIKYTNKVVTLWYRAPELLLQIGKYSTPIDVWSIGCVFGELLTSKPLFPGHSEISQIKLIFEGLGSPNAVLWPDYEEYRKTGRMIIAKPDEYKYNTLLNKLPDRKLLSDKGFHFWNKLLAYDPGVESSSDDDGFVRKATHRITAEAALNHDFFKEEPKPLHPDLFPTWPSKATGGASNSVKSTTTGGATALATSATNQTTSSSASNAAAAACSNALISSGVGLAATSSSVNVGLQEKPDVK